MQARLGRVIFGAFFAFIIACSLIVGSSCRPRATLGSYDPAPPAATALSFAGQDGGAMLSFQGDAWAVVPVGANGQTLKSFDGSVAWIDAPSGTGLVAVASGVTQGAAVSCADAGYVYGWDGGPSCFAAPSPAGWQIVLNQNLTGLATQSFTSDGFVDGGIPDANFPDAWRIFNTANNNNDAGGLALSNDAGLLARPNAASTIASTTFSAPILAFQIVAAASTFSLDQPVSIMTHWTANNAAAANDLGIAGFMTYNSNLANQYLFWGGLGYNSSCSGLGSSLIGVLNSGAGTITSCDPFGDADTVTVTDFPAGAMNFETIEYVGTWSGGWPSRASLKARLTSRTATIAIAYAPNTTDAGQLRSPSDAYAFWGAYRGNAGNSTNLSVTIADVRVDLKN